MQSECIRIPNERVAVLIGKGGKIKKRLESSTETKIDIDSNTGEIEIESKNAINIHKAVNIVKAIGRGFSPEKAFELLDEKYYLDIIDLKEELGKGEKSLIQKRGRIIGKSGKAREEIERETETLISVYGKTVAIIGKGENVEKARKAVEMLLRGAEHSTVYTFLKGEEREKFEL